MVSLGLGSDASNHKGLKHLEASRHIFSSQCIQNRHHSLRTMQTFISSEDNSALTRRRRSVRAPNDWRRATALYCCHTRPRINPPIQDDSPSRLVARPVRSAAIVRSRQRQDKTNGGAERDRTADPLLAKQVLSQLSYSPIQLDHQSLTTRRGNNSHQPQPQPRSIIRKMQMVGPGRLELPTPRLSSVCSNQLSYGPIPVPADAAFVFMKKEKRGRRTSPYQSDYRSNSVAYYISIVT